VSSPISSLIVNGLKPFSEYEFKYRKINILGDLGVSGNSSTLTVMTGSVPPRPSFPLNISLDWNSSATLGVRFDWIAYNISSSNIPASF
jgi:hypothetical protein